MPTLNDLVDNTVAAGTYQARFDEVEATTTRKGDPQVRMQVTIVSGDAKGRVLSDWRMVTPTTFWKLGTDLMHMGVEGRTDVSDLLGNADAVVHALNPFIGKVFRISVRTKTFNDRTRNEFSFENGDDDLD